MKLTHAVAVGLFCILVGTAHAKAATDEPGLVDSLVEPYLQIHTALAGDDLAKAKTAAASLLSVMKSAEGVGDTVSGLATPAKMIGEAPDITRARTGFLNLSNQMVRIVKEMGSTRRPALYVAHCPMAFDGEGGSWIQADATIANPYFGARMLRCGSVKEELGGGSGSKEHDATGDSHSGHQH